MNNKTSTETIADQVKARSLSHLIEDLVRISAEAISNDEIMNPLLTLYLTGGQSLRGWIKDRSPDGSTLLVRHYADPKDHPAASADDICFVPVDKILAISVLAGHRSLL